MQRQSHRKLRRNVPASIQPAASSSRSRSPGTSRGGGSYNRPGAASSSTAGGRNSEYPNTNALLLLVAVILTMYTYLFPPSVDDPTFKIEKEALEAGQELEQEVVDWWKKHESYQQKPPIAEELHPHMQPHPNERQSSSAQGQQGGVGGDGLTATERMNLHSSKWVDGEKKLKAKLKKLAERQAQGKDLGVPILTRYLGEDIPAWVGEGVDKQQWEERVKQKYDEMRAEEEEWKKEMAKIIQNQNYG